MTISLLDHLKFSEAGEDNAFDILQTRVVFNCLWRTESSEHYLETYIILQHKSAY
jgi:hypothetical protein